MTTTVIVFLVVFAVAYCVAALVLAYNYKALQKRGKRIRWVLYTALNGKQYWRPMTDQAGRPKKGKG